MTKRKQKEDALKAYYAIKGPAWKVYTEIEQPAAKAYEAIANQAEKIYRAKCEEIDEQKDDIKIIDGKRYTLIED